MKRIGLTIAVMMVLLVLSGCCLQHQWVEATCGTPRTCSECGKIAGEPTEQHEWIEADCNTTKHCSVCKKYEGAPLGHKWEDATCTEAKICTRCGDVNGEALGHQYNQDGDDFLCGRCGEETEFDSGDMKEILGLYTADYSLFSDNYLGKTFVMKVMKSDVENGIFYGANIYVDDICFFTTYRPATDDMKLLEAGGAPVIRAKLKSVMKGFFDGQYIVFFENATVERETWNE